MVIFTSHLTEMLDCSGNTSVQLRLWCWDWTLEYRKYFASEIQPCHPPVALGSPLLSKRAPGSLSSQGRGTELTSQMCTIARVWEQPGFGFCPLCQIQDPALSLGNLPMRACLRVQYACISVRGWPEDLDKLQSLLLQLKMRSEVLHVCQAQRTCCPC